MSDHETIAIYDAKSDEYASMTQSDARDKQLIAFIKALPKGGAVLDLGCGPGHCAEVMAQAGLAVTAVDASCEMVKLAAAKSGVTARQATFDDLVDVAAFDGVWANFSLLHAPRADLPRHLAAIHRALKSGGRLHIGVKLGEGEARDALGRLYTYFSEDELNARLAKAGFTVLGARKGCSEGLDGTMSDWITITAHA